MTNPIKAPETECPIAWTAFACTYPNCKCQLPSTCDKPLTAPVVGVGEKKTGQFAYEKDAQEYYDSYWDSECKSVSPEPVIEAYCFAAHKHSNDILDEAVRLINDLVYADANNELKIGFNQGITTIREQLNTLRK